MSQAEESNAFLNILNLTDPPQAQQFDIWIYELLEDLTCAPWHCAGANREADRWGSFLPVERDQEARGEGVNSTCDGKWMLRWRMCWMDPMFEWIQCLNGSILNGKVTNVFWILRREAILVAGGTVCFQGNRAEPAACQSDSWACLWDSWACLGDSWACLEDSWACLWDSWGTQ